MLAEFTGTGQEYRRSRAHLVTEDPGGRHHVNRPPAGRGNALYHK
jgi:hypothetical protein